MLSAQTSAKASFIYIVIGYWEFEKIYPQCEPRGLHLIYKQNSHQPNQIPSHPGNLLQKIEKQARRDLCVCDVWFVTVKHR